MKSTAHHCPDDAAFAELFDGVLDPAEQDAFYGALAGCPACQETLVVLGSLLADEPAVLPAPPAGLVERLKARVLPAAPRPAIGARLVAGVWQAIGDIGDGLLAALAPTPRPALATRGAELDGGLRYEIELAGAPVELLLAGMGARATLTARPLDAPPPRARLILLRAGEVQASLAFEAEGVTLPALDPGHYLLRMEIPGVQPAELPLRLEG